MSIFGVKMMVYYFLLFYNINFQLTRLCLDLILQERIIKDFQRQRKFISICFHCLFIMTIDEQGMIIKIRVPSHLWKPLLDRPLPARPAVNIVGK